MDRERPEKKVEWTSDPNLTMTIKKGDLWKPDENLKMRFQESLEKKKKEESESKQ
jgi:hypothetical protein